MKNKVELEKVIKGLEDKSDNLDSAISLVNSATRDIKYNDVPSDIYLKVQGYAEEYGIKEDDLEWKIKEVLECVNKLESANMGFFKAFSKGIPPLGIPLTSQKVSFSLTIFARAS